MGFPSVQGGGSRSVGSSAVFISAGEIRFMFPTGFTLAVPDATRPRAARTERMREIMVPPLNLGPVNAENV